MAVSAQAGSLFWRCASELRRILKENLTDEGKCFAIETLVSEVREELLGALEVGDVVGDDRHELLEIGRAHV